MYYAADLGERAAINKTGLQCVHWQNNLSDSMEKEREDNVKSTRERENGKWMRLKKNGGSRRTEQGLWSSKLMASSSTLKGKAVFPCCS